MAGGVQDGPVGTDASEDRGLVIAERLGPVLATVECARDRVGIPMVDQRERSDHALAIIRYCRVSIRQPPVELGAPAQHVVDELGDGAPIFGADETMAAEIARQELVRRTVGRQLVEEFDRGLGAGAGGHGTDTVNRGVGSPEYREPPGWRELDGVNWAAGIGRLARPISVGSWAAPW